MSILTKFFISLNDFFTTESFPISDKIQRFRSEDPERWRKIMRADSGLLKGEEAKKYKKYLKDPELI